MLKVHSFFIGPCLPGRAGLNCTFCSLGYYQPDSGMETCIKCNDGDITRQEGAVNKEECLSLGKSLLSP